MAHRPPGPSSSPFYDHDFVTNHQQPRRKKKRVPITTRTTEVWICDRCGSRGEFPDPKGYTALETGWLKLDLTRSISLELDTRSDSPYLFGRNIQVLCPSCVVDLARWFQQQQGEERA